ncbi:hypothetical protein SCLCIDRAFT_1187371 [Scleroderma citrinum Foug A]|uniref:Uncharacterized protein n=1 Tax=Scleroderma citrinum Foug A TaxID=1036808 RepID=A0A0C2ZAK2_9AGAM|nr:hypothetical protein SCLCIDRAFT_1187371 [Scleroderma citrinum Foug A]
MDNEEGDLKEMLQVEFRGTSDITKSMDSRKSKFFVFSAEEELVMLEKEVSAATQDGEDDDNDMSNQSPAVCTTPLSATFDKPLRDILKPSSSGGGYQNTDLVRNPSPDILDQGMQLDDHEETNQISHKITHLSMHSPPAHTTPLALDAPPAGRTDLGQTQRIPTPDPPHSMPIDALANERLSKEFTCRAKGMVKDVHDEDKHPKLRVVTRKSKVQSHQKSPSPVPPPDAAPVNLAHDIPGSSTQPSDRDKLSMSTDQSDSKRRRSTNSQTDGICRSDRKRNRRDKVQVANTASVAVARLASTTDPATYMT